MHLKLLENVTMYMGWKALCKCMEASFGNWTQYIAFCQNQSFHKPFSFRMLRIFGCSSWHYISLFINAESLLYWSGKVYQTKYIFSLSWKLSKTLYHVQVDIEVYNIHEFSHSEPKLSETSSLHSLKGTMMGDFGRLFFWHWHSLFISAERALCIHLESWQKKNKNYSEAPLSWRGTVQN